MHAPRRSPSIELREERPSTRVLQTYVSRATSLPSATPAAGHLVVLWRLICHRHEYRTHDCNAWLSANRRSTAMWQCIAAARTHAQCCVRNLARKHQPSPSHTQIQRWPRMQSTPRRLTEGRDGKPNSTTVAETTGVPSKPVWRTPRRANVSRGALTPKVGTLACLALPMARDHAR